MAEGQGRSSKQGVKLLYIRPIHMPTRQISDSCTPLFTKYDLLQNQTASFTLKSAKRMRSVFLL